MAIKLNCDMGESFGIYKMGLDEEIIQLIDMANLACGFHASDSLTMSKSIKLAYSHGVKIGAHPSYQDLVGFGRRSMKCSSSEISALILYQVGALEAFCKVHNTKVSYIKPHGALYNDMMKDDEIFKTIVSTIYAYDKNIKLMILSTPKNDHYKNMAKEYGIKLIYEVFADRAYNDDGSLVSRDKEGAVITKEKDVIKRIQLLKEKGIIKSITGKDLNLKADTICVHGDNEKAIKFVKVIKKTIDEN